MNKKYFYTAIFILCLIVINTQNAASCDNELVDSIIETYESLNGWKEDYREKVDKLDNLLVQFFQTKSSLSFDMETVIPFSSLISSNDEKVRVFSWFTENGGQSWEYHSLIQYETNDGVLKADLIYKMFGANSMPDDPWYSVPAVEYNSISILNREIYLLFGGARASSRGIIMYCFLALELKDNPSPCFVFDGKSYLHFYYIATQGLYYIEDLPAVIDLKSNFPDDFTLVYAKLNNADEIVMEEYRFVFNGKEFEGDYSIFKGRSGR
jgi:hypothetical protein